MTFRTDPETAERAHFRRNWPNCTCPIAYRNVGRLYGVNMGKYVIRLATAPKCPDHGGNR